MIKFYIVILFQINKNYYVAPVSSNKTYYETSFMIKNSKFETLGSIRSNYMIPVNLSNIEELKINNSKFNYSRKQLLRNELRGCNKNHIYNLSKAIYHNRNIILNNNKFMCNFKKLEIACNLYDKFKEFNKVYLIYSNLKLDDLDLNIIDNQLIINNHDNELIRIGSNSDILELIDEIKQKQKEKGLEIGL